MNRELRLIAPLPLLSRVTGERPSDSDEAVQLRSNQLGNFRRNSGASVVDQAGFGIDAPDVADENLADDRKPGREHNAGRERADARGDRAPTARPVFAVNAVAETTRLPAARLLSAPGRIEIGPDQIAAFRHIGRSRRSSTASDPTSGPQSKGSA